MSKRSKIIVAIIFLLIIAAMNIVSYQNYNNYITYKNKFEQSDKELAVYKLKADELNKKIIAENNNSDDKVKSVAKDFVNTYFNFTAKNQYKIYNNIKPYATESLIDKIRPHGDFQSDFDYKSSVENIKLYYEKVDSDKASILVFGEQKISTESIEGTSNPILLNLELIFSEGKWMVDDISINTIKNELR